MMQVREPSGSVWELLGLLSTTYVAVCEDMSRSPRVPKDPPAALIPPRPSPGAHRAQPPTPARRVGEGTQGPVSLRGPATLRPGGGRRAEIEPGAV